MNQKADFGPDIDWKCEDKGRLWRYNLHYFQYLHHSGLMESSLAGKLIKHWISHNPPGTPDAWDPFPVSLRLVNWIKYLSQAHIDTRTFIPCIRSAYSQALWLEHSIEWHLLANHLFKNIKALIFAGLFFKGHDAKRWLRKGLSLLEKELYEQILPDGGHFERSPMYHSMILEDCLDLLNIFYCSEEPAVRPFVEKLENVSKKMIEFLVYMIHPDGQIALFNDAAFGIEPLPADLFNYYKIVTGEEKCFPNGYFRTFPQSGYYVMSPASGDKMIIDCGPIGPDYQPGHAHCDLLSFELSIDHKRIIVDSGCYGYEESPIRHYNRGNVGHNTLTIDNRNQSEVWGAHRCARRAYPLFADIKKEDGNRIVFEGAHDGYKRLPGHPIHYRKVHWDENMITIEDNIKGEGCHLIESLLHIHPDFSVKLEQNKVFLQGECGNVLSISPLKFGNLEITEGWYCPEFGLKLVCPVVRMRFGSANLPFRAGWRLEILN
ncbi:MAG: heparinase [Chlorobi bacterium]|nr:heparinase [Chlorobiota bacterium]